MPVPRERPRRRDAARPPEPPSLPTPALPGRDRDPVAGSDRAGPASRPARRAPTSASSSPRSWASTSSAASCTRTRSPGESFDVPYDSLIVAAGAGQSYFGHDEFALFAPGHEDDRRRPRAPAADLRRLRDGRDGDRSRASAGSGSRSRSSAPGRREWRSRDRSASSRSGASRDDFRSFDPDVGARDPARRGQGARGVVRSRPVGARGAPARRARGRAPDGRARHRTST